MAKISQIKFHNFRVYKESIFNIDKDKNIILLYGRNGSGKSSFFDGIEWGLTGKINRYENDDLSANEKKGSQILKNIEATDSAFVKIKFDEKDLEIERIVTSVPNSQTDYCEGNLISKTDIGDFLVNPANKSDIDFSESFNFSHLLPQEEISNFIRATKDTDRFQTIVRLFGLESYKQYDNHIKEFKKFIKNEVSIQNESISELKNEIENNKIKEQKLPIDEEIIRTDLLRKTNKEATPSSIESILKEVNKNYDRSQLLKSKIQTVIEDLSTLQLNYEENEKERDTLIEYKNRHTEIEKFIIEFKKLGRYNYIAENLATYTNVKENQIKNNEIAKHFENVRQSEDVKLLLKAESTFEEKLNGLIILDSSNQELIDLYNQLINTKNQNESTIIKLNDQLTSLSTVASKLFSSALDYFKQNNEIKDCPVCNNQFDLIRTTDRLKQYLEQPDHELFNDLYQIIEQHQLTRQTVNSDFEICRSKLDQRFKESIALFDKMKEKSEIISKNNNIYQQVSEYLAHLNLKQEDFHASYALQMLTINENPLHFEGQKLNYYETLLIDQNNAINYLEEQTKIHFNLCEKYKIKNIQNIDYKLDQYQTRLIHLLDYSNQTVELKSQAFQLQTHYSNNIIIENIKIQEATLIKEQDKLRILTDIEKEYKNLEIAVKASINGEMEKKLSQYKQSIKKIYKYLNPHMTMNKLELKFESTQSNTGRLRFGVSDNNENQLNPTYTFSAAQNNVLALSIFLSFALKQSWSNLNAVFLDDPIQNMDDINVHAFIDMIRSTIKKADKQFFISTHDERIKRFMMNKFGHSNVQLFEFVSYGKIKEVTND